MHAYIRTYILTYVLIYIYTYMHTYIHIYIHAYIRTCIRTYIHTYIHTCVHTFTVVPRKSSFPTILEDFESRNEILNDIMELLEFLKQREVELTSEGSGVLQVSTHLAETLQVHSGDDLVKMIDGVKKVMEKLTDKRTQHLLLILDSER